MHDFHYRDGILYCEDLNIKKICEFVPTPFYLYSRKTISDHYLKLHNAFYDIPHLICYSLKACSNINIIRMLGELGAGADIVSGGELFRALRAGINPSKIVYSGVGKTNKEIFEAISVGILMFNAESEEEVFIIDRISARVGRKQKVALRINPSVNLDIHDYISTGKKGTKFGISFERAKTVYKKIAELKNIEVAGIDCHIGSQILQSQPYIDAIDKLRFLLRELKDEGINLSHLNIGGGLGIIYDEEKPQTAMQFRSAINHLIKDLNLILLMEPGRFIVGNAGILLSKVLFVKNEEGKTFIILDAGMNDLIRPTLYKAFHKIQPVVMREGEENIVADVVGPVCESGDFFALQREIPSLQRGEFVAIMSAGAYGFSMSSNYNSRPRAAEVLVEGKSFRIIRKKEEYDDLIRGEI